MGRCNEGFHTYPRTTFEQQWKVAIQSGTKTKLLGLSFFYH
jgi:hypothetical protein